MSARNGSWDMLTSIFVWTRGQQIMGLLVPMQADSNMFRQITSQQSVLKFSGGEALQRETKMFKC